MKSILLAVLSGLLLILCFPKFDMGYLAWFALVPLLIAIKDKSLMSAFGLCCLTGIFYHGGFFYWIKLVNNVNWATFILLVIYLSICYFGFFGLGFNYVSKRTKLPSIVIAPVLWISLEYARSNAGFLEAPLGLMAQTQYLNIPLIQISAFTGVYGVSFLIVMVNVAISDLIHSRSKALKPIIATIIVLVVSFAYGYSVITKVPGSDSVNVTVVQANIPQEIKWNPEFINLHFQKHIRMSKEASNDGASLIVWPEATVQRAFKHDISILRKLSTVAIESKAHLLFGSSQYSKSGSGESRRKNMFNSAFLLSPEKGIIGDYNRIRLIPFAEYLPYRDFFPWPMWIASNAANFAPGTKYTIFNLNGIKFGVLICTETTFPGHFRQFVKKGANFMVNIINEAPFGDNAAPYQLASMSVFRAVENRTSLVRCANTGISCFIDPHGRIIGRVHDHNGKETFVEGYLTKEIPLSHKKTFYTRYGDVFVYMNMAVVVFMVGLSFFRGKKSSHAKLPGQKTPRTFPGQKTPRTFPGQKAPRTSAKSLKKHKK